MHIDLGPARSWGERLPKRETAFAVEMPPAREVLADSRILQGGGAAGAATIVAAGVEVAQEAIAETQGAICRWSLPRHPAVAVHRERRSPASPSRSTAASIIGSGAVGDRRLIGRTGAGSMG
jgi:hypothetical protein